MQTIPDSEIEAAHAAQAAQAEAEVARVTARRGVTRRSGRGGRADSGLGPERRVGGRRGGGEVEGGVDGMRGRLRARRGLDPDGDAGAAGAAGAARAADNGKGNENVAGAGDAQGNAGLPRPLDAADALSAASHATLSAIAVLLASMEALPAPRAGDEQHDELYGEVTQQMTQLSGLIERYLSGLPTE